MDNQTDQHLLRDYAGLKSDAAFAELVRRHIDLVYSAALRMVRDTHLAEDVTQAVFLGLAQNAPKLTDRAILSGWLHRTTQNLAANVVRSDVRRRAREQEAATMNELLAHETDPGWTQVAPHLDAALGELNETDRDAVLMRYFERKSAREMAAILGGSEEAAQKRVTRAVERLRDLFTKRGLALGASGLATAISANAVQAAPVGLATAIVSAASLTGAAIATSTTAAATKAIAMTTLQKALVTATIAITTGAGLFEAHRASALQTQLSASQQQAANLQEQFDTAEAEKNAAIAREAALAAVANRNRSSDAELLRLRAESARSQEQLAAALNEAKAARESESLAQQILSNTPPVRTYFSTTATSVPWNQSIVTGGWKTPSGIRTAIVSTPHYDPVAVGAVVVQSKLIEYGDEAAKALGLDGLNTDKQYSTKSVPLNVEQTEALLELAKTNTMVKIVGSPSVVTLSGSPAQIQIGQSRPMPSGELYTTGPILDLIPTISPDGQSVQLVLSAHLNYSTLPKDN